MPTLTVPAPQPSWEGDAASAELEKPVNVKLAALSFADGQPATQDELQKIGAYIYRSSGGTEEIWNEDEQGWQAPPVDPSALQPLPLAYKDGEAEPWQGVLAAAGQKDQHDAPRYDTASNGEPSYRLRAFARFTHGGETHEGLSAPSAAFTFVSAAENQRYTLSFDTETPADCTRAKLELKNASLVTAAYIELRASGTEVEIANCTGSGAVLARVLLNAAGDIELSPAPGRKLIVHGDIEAEHLRYQPSAGGAKQDL